MKKFSGLITALVTPFLDGKIDLESLGKLIDFQLRNKVQGFVINGTTAESANLTESEIETLFIFAKKQVPGDFPLIMGTGSNSTRNSITQSQHAEKIGADAVLTVVPYYNKPPQRGLFAHFKSIADSINLPVILYNVPSRTIVSLEIDTIKKLSSHPQIIGIKEASGSIELAKQIRQNCGTEFLLLSGDDATYAEFMQAGGDGIISVASHIIPREMFNRNSPQFKRLIDLLFIEANPIAVKRALFEMGIIRSAELRLPLVELQENLAQELKNEMKNCRLI